MRFPKQYIKNNGLQRKNAEDTCNTYIQRMVWKSNETILDIGCGPGDVTSDILYPLLMNNINQLIGVDKSTEMVEYAKKTYAGSKICFDVLDIENSNDCFFYSNRFDKIFSFFCFHWVHNKPDTLSNLRLMLKNGGEILINFLLINPFAELYTSLDAEWQKYVKDLPKMIHNLYSKVEIRDIFIKAGFRVINLESSIKKFSFSDLSSFLNYIKAVDDMYTLLPQQSHERYFVHVKEKLCKTKAVKICPVTGMVTFSYLPITVHAIKD